eukprot:403365580
MKTSHYQYLLRRGIQFLSVVIKIQIIFRKHYLLCIYGSEVRRPCFSTSTINSILINQTSTTFNTDQTKLQVVQNGKSFIFMANSQNYFNNYDFNNANDGLMKKEHQQHLSFQFDNGSSNYNKNRQIYNILNKYDRQYLSNSDSDDSEDSDYYEEEEHQNFKYNNYNNNNQYIPFTQNQNQNYQNYHYKPQGVANEELLEAVGLRDLAI